MYGTVKANTMLTAQQAKPLLFCVVILSLVWLYKVDAFCVLRGGVVTLQSHGEETMGGLVVRNGCNTHHLPSKGGVSVVGVGRFGIDSVHVGYIEDFNRVEKIEEIDTQLSTLAKRHRFVGIVANGGTHHKPALARIRDDVAIEINTSVTADEYSLVGFFRKYDLGRFLSVDHGCCRGYIALYDTVMKQKVAEKIGEVGAKLEHNVTI